jgi:hypothetical protein
VDCIHQLKTLEVSQPQHEDHEVSARITDLCIVVNAASPDALLTLENMVSQLTHLLLHPEDNLLARLSREVMRDPVPMLGLDDP